MKLWGCRGIPQHNPTFSATVINGNSTQIGHWSQNRALLQVLHVFKENLQSPIQQNQSRHHSVRKSQLITHVVSPIFSTVPMSAPSTSPSPIFSVFSVLSVLHPLFSPLILISKSRTLTPGKMGFQHCHSSTKSLDSVYNMWRTPCTTLKEHQGLEHFLTKCEKVDALLRILWDIESTKQMSVCLSHNFPRFPLNL